MLQAGKSQQNKDIRRLLVRLDIILMGAFSFLYDHLRTFRNILVHSTQEMNDPDGAVFRGGPDWPHFKTQIFARHCRGAIARPVDSAPMPALPEWPYYDPQLFLQQPWARPPE